jgi:CHAT domain-containing protein
MDDYESDQQIKQYLLGTLAPEQQEHLEERLLCDEAYTEQVAIGEEELLDSYVSQELSAPERKQFETYFLVTPERHRKLRSARALRQYLAQQKPAPVSAPAPDPVADSARDFLTLLRQLVRKPSWGVVVPALLVVFVGVFAWKVFFSQSELDKGLATLKAAYREQRPIESRIASFSYAPFIVTRGDETTKVDGVKAKLAERILLDQADQLKNAAAFYALGKLHLSQRKFEDAIQQFEAALKTDPDNAQLHNDLAAALMEKALWESTQPNAGQSLETYAQSREHLEKALQLDSRLLDALFNLALWQQRQRLWAQAEESWQKYLEKDSRSRWAEDAQQYLKEARARKNQVSKTKEQLLKEFLQAHQNNDPDQAFSVLSHNREAISEKLIWWLLTDELLKPSSDYSAEQLLHALTFAGDLEAARADDHFTSALAKYYRAVSLEQRERLAQAHQAVKNGHADAQLSKFNEAIEQYQQAKLLFEQAGNKGETRFTEFILGLFYFQNRNIEASQALLVPLSRQCKVAKYQWLLSQTLYAMAPANFDQAVYTRGINESKLSLKIARAIVDPLGEQKSLSQLANQYSYLGDLRQSLDYLQQYQSSADAYPPSERQMWRNGVILAEVVNSLDYYAAAADYQKEALRIAQKSSNPDQLYLSYVRLGNLYGRLQNYDTALQYAQLGLKIAQGHSEQKGWRKNMAYASLQIGNLYRQVGDFRQSFLSYNQSANLYQELNEQVRIYDVHKGRLQCYLAQGNDEAAQSELKTALDYAEKYRDNILEEQQKNTYFDNEQSIYDLAIDFEYSRKGNARAAFEYAEASRARSLLSAVAPGGQPFSLTEIQNRLPEAAQLVLYAALEDKLLIWVISKSGFQPVVQQVTLRELHDLALNYQRLASDAIVSEKNRDELRLAATRLHQLLLTPIEPLLDQHKSICIVPDKVLCYLPFSALISPVTGHYLLTDYRLSFAPSSTIYLRSSESAQQRSTVANEKLLSVGNPSFDREVFARLNDLPAARREAEQIARLYGTQALIGEQAREAAIKRQMTQADVVHLASHYVVDDRSPMQSKLLLTKEAEGQNEDGILQGQELYERKLSRPRLVVLSACRSGIERYYNGEGMVGMSRAYLASGVPLIVASLWPVESQATAELMISFHRHRRQDGGSTAEALRRAQLEMMQSADTRNQNPYYWASFVAIGGYTSY